MKVPEGSGCAECANCLIVIPTEASVLQVGAEVACVRIDLPEGSVL